MKSRDQLLTKSKAKWSKSRPDKALNGLPLHYNVTIEKEYTKAIRELIAEMSSQTIKTMRRVFKKNENILTMDASLSSQSRITLNRLKSKFIKLFKDKSDSIIDRMLKQTSKASASSINMSLKQLTGGFSLKGNILTPEVNETFKALSAENVALFRLIPETFFKNVTGAVMRGIIAGKGISAIDPIVRKYHEGSARQAELAALDQTRKAFTAVNKVRLEYHGITQFRWIHSGGGQHPRKSHQALNGKIFNFDNPPIINQEQVDKGYEAPEKGLPSQAINCRCVLQAVVKFPD